MPILSACLRRLDATTSRFSGWAFEFLRRVYKDEPVAARGVQAVMHEGLRRSWRLVRPLVPTSVKARFVSRGAQWGVAVVARRSDSWEERVRVNPMLLPPALRGDASPEAPDRADGMEDYPRTRPHIAFAYLSGLVHWLADSDFEVMSYRDLAGVPRYSEETDEFRRWIANAESSGTRAVLLQYDVDARPDVTMRLLEQHIKLGVPANVMVFRRKVFDWKLKRQGVVEIDESYELDFDLLRRFEQAGGVVGYHCNAFDLAGGDADRAIEIFLEDVEALREHFDIRFFSMHGGHVTDDGRCNGNLPVVPYLEQLGLTWVHNGHSIHFHRNWADGSASNPRYRNESNDPLDFIMATRPAERTRLLFHPQYYNDFENQSFSFPMLSDQTWVAEAKASVETGSFDGLGYWRDRAKALGKTNHTYASLFESPAGESPIFINGMSRSGTTLLASMFDAHVDVSMAYESYPHYLHDASDGGVLTAEEFLYFCSCLINYPEDTAFALIDRAPLRNLRRFAAVSNWTGMTSREIGELVRTYLFACPRIETPGQALEVVAATARFKQRNDGTRTWGSKCQGNFDDYFKIWPDATIIYIVRNGLDVFASQKSNGAFNPEAKKLARAWRTQHDRFAAYRSAHPERRCLMVRYEELVRAPEATSRSLCEELGLRYDPQMIRQHEVENTLVRRPRGQLSAERIQQPIDQRAVGRWRALLSEAEVDEFLADSGVRDLMNQYRYETGR